MSQNRKGNIESISALLKQLKVRQQELEAQLREEMEQERLANAEEQREIKNAPTKKPTSPTPATKKNSVQTPANGKTPKQPQVKQQVPQPKQQAPKTKAPAPQNKPVQNVAPKVNTSMPKENKPTVKQVPVNREQDAEVKKAAKESKAMTDELKKDVQKDMAKNGYAPEVVEQKHSYVLQSRNLVEGGHTIVTIYSTSFTYEVYSGDIRKLKRKVLRDFAPLCRVPDGADYSEELNFALGIFIQKVKLKNGDVVTRYMVSITESVHNPLLLGLPEKFRTKVLVPTK